jgi:cytochrome c oxidase subunit IV
MADADIPGGTPGSPEVTTGAVATEEPPATPELEAAPGHDPLLHRGAAHAHPSPAKYVGIAVLLAIITGIEVAIYYINMPDPLMVAFLLVLAILKFSLVAAFFMHLKFDSPMLRRVFVAGIILAAVVYTVALLTLRVLV